MRDRRGRAPPPGREPFPRAPSRLPPRRALTDEEDGEGDEEQENVRHHVERVHEAAVVEDALVHPVGGRVVLGTAEGQGHGGARTGSARAPRASRVAVPRSSQNSRTARPAPPRPHLPLGPAPSRPPAAPVG